MALPFLHELETQALTLVKRVAEESHPLTMRQSETLCDYFNLNGEQRKKITTINEKLIDANSKEQQSTEVKTLYGIMDLLGGTQK